MERERDVLCQAGAWHAETGHRIHSSSLCAEADYNQGNHDSGLNPS